MDIVDSQAHLGPGGAAEMVSALNALGIASVLIDEWWMGTPGHPGYWVGPGGKAFRTTSPTAELAAWTYPGRFSYLVRVDRLDPEVRQVVKFARDSTHVRALRTSPGMNRAELADFAKGADLLVHEAMLAEGLEALLKRIGNGDDRLMHHWLRAHTMAADAGRTATEAGVKALAFHHLITSDDPDFGPADWQRAVAPVWQGAFHLGQDGLRLPL